MSNAGKGDDYRPVNKKRWDDNYERIFGRKPDIADDTEKTGHSSGNDHENLK